MFIKVYTSGDGQHSQTITPTIFPATIGRSLDNTVILSNNSVSSHHAQIEERLDGYYLVDLGSTNGVFYKKTKVKELKIDGTKEIYLGEIRIEVGITVEAHEKTRVIHLESHLANLRKPKHLSLYFSAILLYFLLVIDRFLAEPLTGKMFAAGLGFWFGSFFMVLFAALFTSFPRIKQFYLMHFEILFKAFTLFIGLGLFVDMFASLIPDGTGYTEVFGFLAIGIYIGASSLLLYKEWGFHKPWQRVFASLSIFVLPVLVFIGINYSERGEGYHESEYLTTGYPWIASTNKPNSEILNQKIDIAFKNLDKAKDKDEDKSADK